MTYFLAIAAQLLSAAGMIVLFLLWWPLRKTDALRTIPWFLGAIAIGWIISLLTRSAVNQYREATDAMQVGSSVIANFAIGTIALGALWKFLCYLLLCSNAAFLLDRIGVTSSVIRPLKAIYTFHIPLGIALILASAVSSSLLWIFVNFALLQK